MKDDERSTIMEHWRMKMVREYRSSRRKTSQEYFAHQKSHINCPGIDLLVSPFIDLWSALRTRRYFIVPYLSVSVSCTVKEKVVLPNCNKFD
jgi:hypothetical protein